MLAPKLLANYSDHGNIFPPPPASIYFLNYRRREQHKDLIVACHVILCLITNETKISQIISENVDNFLINTVYSVQDRKKVPK